MILALVGLSRGVGRMSQLGASLGVWLSQVSQEAWYQAGLCHLVYQNYPLNMV